MPKLANQYINVRAQSGEKFAEEVPCKVMSNGQFYLGVPEVEGFEAAFKDVHQNPDLPERQRFFIKEDRHGRWIIGDSLEKVLKAAHLAATQLLEYETIEERVIVYGFAGQSISYVNEENGEMVTIQELAGREDAEEIVYGEDSWNRRWEDYHAGLFAAAYVKKTMKRDGFVRVDYEIDYGDQGHMDVPDNPAAMLNSFRRLGRKVENYNQDGLDEGLHEIPYTSERAEFFINALLSICKLNHKLQTFIDDREQLLTRIDSGQRLIEG